MAAYADQNAEVPSWRCSLAHIYAQLGDHDRAARELDVGDFSTFPRNALWLLRIAFVGTTACMLDDHSCSRDAYELLLPYANTCLVALSLVCEGSTSRPLGMLATTLGRCDDAEAHFERALEMNARIRSPLWTAHTQFEYARLQLLRNEPGNPRQGAPAP